ncbi:hypothetical protein Hanom_Chr12g01167741 [Helianthus anomalus]
MGREQQHSAGMEPPPTAPLSAMIKKKRTGVKKFAAREGGHFPLWSLHFTIWSLH